MWFDAVSFKKLSIMMSKTSSPSGADSFQPNPSKTPVFINLLLDNWFKRAFTRKDILLLTLQMILPEKNISDVKLVRNEHTNPFPLAKNVLIDVECTTQDGARFIVELQKERQAFFQERILYYSSFAIQQQVPKGESLYDFMPVYMISLLNFCFHENENGEVKFVYQLSRSGKPDELMTENITYIYIEMPNHRSPDDPDATRLDKFCWLLRNMSKFSKRPEESENDALFRLLLDSADFSTFGATDKIKYEDDMTSERDLINQLAYREELGRTEGIEETKLATAKKMLAMDFGLDVIAQVTDLPMGTLKKLK